MSNRRLQVSVVLTHPVQYFSPWFRYIHEHAPEVRLRVLYAVQPTPEAQAAGFGGAFSWDRPLLDGYESRVLGTSDSGANLSAERFSVVDAPNLEAALVEDRPDCVLVPGWHARVYRRALDVCRRHGIPALYRGDSNLQSAPSGLRGLAWAWHTRRMLQRYAAFLAVGTRADEYLRRFDIPAVLRFPSPHAVDNAFFAQARTGQPPTADAFGLASAALTVLYVGKLEAKKRPLDAIRAVARLDNAQLLVVGTGPLEDACRAEARRLNARVVFAGFVNQSRLIEAYAAADCLILPSDGRETWGLVVNEAMAAGLPAVVSDQVGCQPDLVREGETGAVATCGDVDALAAALTRVRQARDGGHDFAGRCRDAVARHDFEAATKGLVDACRRLARRDAATQENRDRTPRVLACCEQMVLDGGMERLTFEVLRALRDSGAGVHCRLNRQESIRILPMVERTGAAWSIIGSDPPLSRRFKGIRVAWSMWRDLFRGTFDLLASAARFRPTHILAPDFVIVARYWPALVFLRRATGTRIILRVGMPPSLGTFYHVLWRWVISSATDRIICNSEFFRQGALAHHVPARKLGVIPNRVSLRIPAEPRVRDRWRVVYAGQLIPGKGLDRLIEAIGLLRSGGMPATLDVAADMNAWESPSYHGYQARVRELAERPEVDGAIRFLGRREDILTVLGEAAVHCCPSRLSHRDGPANVVLEAKATATPSVITRSGALPEMVEHRVDGWITDDDDAASLAAGLRYFLQDAERRERAGDAALRSLSRFASDTFARAWGAEFGLRDLPPQLCQATEVQK